VITAIPDDAWTPVRYPGAVLDPDTGQLISDAEVAERCSPRSRPPSTRSPPDWWCAGSATRPSWTSCSRCGGITTPGSNESAGRVKSSKTRPGNPYLQGALGAAAMVCAAHPHTYLGAKYRRIATRRGPMKANVAIQHAMLTAIWHMGTTGELYSDPGADYFTRLHPDRAKKRAIHQLQAMGYHVTLDQAS